MTRSPQLCAHRPRGRTLIPISILLALLALTPGWAAEAPMPLDPLTADEEQRAAALAQADPRVIALLGPGRSVLATVELVVQKGSDDVSDPEQPPAIGRHAQVLFARYEGHAGVRALVDLMANQVTAVDAISGDDVSMNIAELRAAWALARPHPEVRQALGTEADLYQVLDDPDPDAPEPSHRVEGLRIRGSEAADRCFQRRCLALIFQRLDEYLANTEVLVDLTTETVTVTATESAGETEAGSAAGAAHHHHQPAAARRTP